MNKKLIAIVIAALIINIINVPIYAVTGGISIESIERSQHKQVSPSKKAEITDKETIKEVQELLNDKGYQCGTPDGIAGKNTCSAIIKYKTDNNMEETSTINQELLNSLKEITPTPKPSTTPTPKPNTSTYNYVPKTIVHMCQAGGCDKEGTYHIEGVSGLTEYYCAKHYWEVLEMYMDLVDKYNSKP